MNITVVRAHFDYGLSSHPQRQRPAVHTRLSIIRHLFRRNTQPFSEGNRA